MRKALRVAILGSGFSMLAGTGCMEMEKHQSLAMTPPAVQSAINSAASGQKIKKIEKENENGATVYEASFESEGADRTVTFSEAGDILEEETEVKVASLPPAVSAAVLKAQPLARVKEAESVKKGGQSYFEIKAEVGEDDHELAIDADGKLISDKVEADEDEEHEKGGHEGKHHEHDGEHEHEEKH